MAFEATVGEYDDLMEIGVYDTRDEALIALAEFAITQSRIEYAKVTEI
jgi:hypothetical protein